MIEEPILRWLRSIVGSVDYGCCLINDSLEVPDWLRHMVENPEEHDAVEYEVQNNLQIAGEENGWATWVATGQDVELMWRWDGEIHMASFTTSKFPSPEAIHECEKQMITQKRGEEDD